MQTEGLNVQHKRSVCNILFRVIKVKCDIKYKRVTDGISKTILMVIQYHIFINHKGENSKPPH